MERRLFFRDFRLSVSIGIHDSEQKAPQTVVLNVDLVLAPPDKPHGDRIANVLNYDTVHDAIVALAGSRHFNLQETLVDAILDLCLAQPGVIEARVSTEKPDVYRDCRVGYEAVRGRLGGGGPRLKPANRHLLGAFAAMLFVGASWGANLPVSKVMLSYFDLFPMSALRIVAATAALAALLWLVEGRRALTIDIDARRFVWLGLMMSGFFALYLVGLQFSNPITVAAVQVAGPLVSAATVRVVTGLRFDPGFGVALGLTLLGGLILAASNLSGAGHVTFGGGEIVVLSSNT